MNVLSVEEAGALLEPPQGATLKQHGPVRWIDTCYRCTSRRCGAPTFLKVDGVPICSKHAIDILNDMVFKLRGR